MSSADDLRSRIDLLERQLQAKDEEMRKQLQEKDEAMQEQLRAKDRHIEECNRQLRAKDRCAVLDLPMNIIAMIVCYIVRQERTFAGVLPLARTHSTFHRLLLELVISCDMDDDGRRRRVAKTRERITGARGATVDERTRAAMLRDLDVTEAVCTVRKISIIDDDTLSRALLDTALRMTRRWQAHEQLVLHDSLCGTHTADHGDTGAADERAARLAYPCPAFDQFADAVLCHMQLPGASRCRLHLRHAALGAAMRGLEKDGLALLRDSVPAAVHRTGDNRMTYTNGHSAWYVKVSKVDLEFAAAMKGRGPVLGMWMAGGHSYIHWHMSSFTNANALEQFRIQVKKVEDMAAFMPKDRVTDIVCKLAKRAGIAHHDAGLIDSAWFWMVDRFALVLEQCVEELSVIDLEEQHNPLQVGCRINGSYCHRDLVQAAEKKIAEAEETTETLADEDGSNDVSTDEDETFSDVSSDVSSDDATESPELEVERGDDADVRWDEKHREWVLLPCAAQLEEKYGLYAGTSWIGLADRSACSRDDEGMDNGRDHEDD